MDRAIIGVDGNCGFALLGEDLQSGEAEFVEIDSKDTAGSGPWCEAANVASRRALSKLRQRLGYTLESGKHLSYALDQSHPLFV